MAAAGEPEQVNLRRAISTTYYALFHLLARSSADLLVGDDNADRSKHAWRQVYRSLEHRHVVDCCKKTTVVNQFPQQIQKFAALFVDLQLKRHHADYNPHAEIIRSTVLEDINAAHQVIGDFESVSVKDRRAFCAYVLFKERKS